MFDPTECAAVTSTRLDGSPYPLEILSAHPPAPTGRPHLLFVHGAFGAAWCWAEYFLPWFAARGWSAHAVSLRGHGESGGSGLLALHSLRCYVDDVRRAVHHLRQPVILIGHSMGGMAVQKTVGTVPAVAMALMAPLGPAGLLPTSANLFASNPTMWWNAGIALAMGPRHADMTQVRQALFTRHLARGDADRYLLRMGGESVRAALDCSMPGMIAPALLSGLPSLVLGCRDDQLVPPGSLRATGLWHGADVTILDHGGHLLMLDVAWEQAAEHLLGWMERVLTR